MEMGKAATPGMVQGRRVVAAGWAAEEEEEVEEEEEELKEDADAASGWEEVAMGRRVGGRKARASFWCSGRAVTCREGGTGLILVMAPCWVGVGGCRWVGLGGVVGGCVEGWVGGTYAAVGRVEGLGLHDE